MKAGKLTVVEYEGAKFTVSLTWRELKEVQQQLEAAEGKESVGIAVMERTLCNAIRSCEGVTGTDGKPVNKIDARFLGTCAPEQVTGLFKAVMFAGGGTVPGPLAQTAAASDEASAS